MFVSQPIDGAVYIAQRRQRGGKLLIWTRVPVAPGPETSLYGPRGNFAGVYKGPPIRVEERLDDHCLHIRLTHFCKGASKLTGATDQYWFKSDAHTRSG